MIRVVNGITENRYESYRYVVFDVPVHSMIVVVELDECRSGHLPKESFLLFLQDGTLFEFYVKFWDGFQVEAGVPGTLRFTHGRSGSCLAKGES